MPATDHSNRLPALAELIDLPAPNRCRIRALRHAAAGSIYRTARRPEADRCTAATISGVTLTR
jgi:hypothetical protein